ncbi:helicase-exonuclease AddAB subunit AddB [Lachnospiraceae bacterium NSJ-143]|nr:helicase-exonuclease AddAB subunit AddB [Lachnospiraceae bacterium NSJ-143]
MGLRFITGRAGSGKSYMCLKEIAAKQEMSSVPPLFYIVPEQYTLQGERDIIAFTKGRAIMKAQVLSFNRLSYNIFSRTGLPSKTPLDDIGKALILKKTVSENKSSFLYFKSCCDRSGFIEQLSNIITEFFKYDISLDRLSEAYGSTDDTALKYKLNDLSIIYSEFLKHISEGYISPDTALDMLYENISKSTFVDGAEIWIDGFSSFTPQELKIIERLIELSDNVTITLTIGRPALLNDSLSQTSVFYEPKDTYNRLLSIAHKTGTAIENIYCDNIFRFKSPVLKHLESSLLTYSSKPSDLSDGICFYEAKDRFDEAEYVACSIISMVKEKALRFRDIAVLTGDIEGTVNTLKNIFSQNNIPFFADIKRGLNGFPLITLVMGLLDSLTDGMAYDSVFSMLKTGLLPFDEDEIEILENYVLSHGIKSYKWHNVWQYNDINSSQEGFNEKINSLRERVLDLTGLLSAKFENRKKYSVASISSALYSFLIESGAAEKIKKAAEAFEAEGDFTKSYENRQCFNAFCSILDTFCSISGGDSTTLRSYRDMLESAADAKKIGIVPPKADSVIIGDIERTRLSKTKALFIINANEGMFPKNTSPQGVFSDTERGLICACGLKLASGAKESAFLQQFNVYSALTRPSDILHISYIKSGALAPSPAVSRLKKIFPKAPVYSPDDEHIRALILSSAHCTFHNIGKGLKNGYGLYTDAYEYFKESPQWKKKASVLEKALTYSGPCQYLSKNTAAEYFSGSLYSSISRLEKFSSCPYMYFMSYTLNAKERPLYQINTPDLGILFHSVIEEFSRKLQERGIDWSNAESDEISALTDSAVESSISGFSSDVFFSSHTTKYLLTRLKRVSERAVCTLISHVKKGSFSPCAFELGFGSGGLPPIVIDLGDNRRMFLTGKVDRVDILDDSGNVYVKIIDYKTSDRSFSLQDIYYGLQLQLMIYIDAILKSGIFKGKTLLPGGVFYFVIKDPIIQASEDLTAEDIMLLIEKKLKMSGLVLMDEKVIRALDSTFQKESDVIPVSYKTDGSFSQSSSVVNQKTFMAIMDYCRKTAADIGRGIVSGNINPLPYVNGSKTPCSYCAYKSACSFDPDSDRARILRSVKKEDIIKKIAPEE